MQTHLVRGLGVESVELQTTADDPEAVGRVLQRSRPRGGKAGGGIHDRKEHRSEELVEGDHFPCRRDTDAYGSCEGSLWLLRKSVRVHHMAKG